MPSIYIVGSLQNIPEIQAFAETLRKQEHIIANNIEIIDYWTSQGSTLDIEFANYAHDRNWDYSKALSNPIARNACRVDREMIEGAFGVILLHPCGKSGHLELGYAIGRGKVTAIVRTSPEFEKVDIMDNLATFIVDTPRDFVESILPKFVARLWNHSIF